MKFGKYIQMSAVCLIISIILSGCSRISKKEYEQTISNIYGENGLKGIIHIENIRGQGFLYSTPYTRVEFDFTEIVDNKPITVSNTMFFEYKTTNLEKGNEVVRTEDLTDLTMYNGIVQSFALQEESATLKKNIKEELQGKMQIENVNLKEVEPRLMTFPFLNAEEEIGSFAENFSLYKEDVVKNQELEKPFKGYYDINIEKYMKLGLIYVSVSYENLSETLFPDGLEELDRNIHDTILNLNTANFYDGVYTLSYDIVTKERSRTGGISYTFHIQNKKISYLSDKS